MGPGTLSATLDTSTNELTYHVVFDGLTGPAAAAHFHGPAAPGANAGPQVAVKMTPIVSPIDGTATLTPEQAKGPAGGEGGTSISIRRRIRVERSVGQVTKGK